MLLKKENIVDLDRKYRLHLINSITGIKPANLIGTRSHAGQDNVAIFSSVVHLGSQPAQIGLVIRPQTRRISDTYANITETGFYTINHVSKDFIKKAHYTSAKLEKGNSEFDFTNLARTFIGDFYAPFVEDSPLKIGMKFLESIALPNGCHFVVGEVELVQVPEAAMNDLGQINLEQYNATGISGLNSYYTLQHTATFPHVKVNELPEFKE